MSEPRILLWDIETDGINADRVLCIGYKWHGKKVKLLKAADYYREGLWDDKGLIEAFGHVFEEADYHVTWYGERFDLPIIKARRIANELQPLRPVTHIDLWKTAYKYFRTGGGNRLAKWQDFLGIKDEKTPVKPSVWIKARYGHGPSLKYIYDHCIKDVDVLEDVFDRLRPWLLDEPSRALFARSTGQSCISCGSTHLTRQGWRIARTRRYQQLKCQTCGKWQAETSADKATIGKLKP